MKRPICFAIAAVMALVSTVWIQHERPASASSGQCVGISGQCPARTGAAETNTLGYGGYGDSVYRISCTFPHVDSALVLSFTGSLTEGLGDESWGLDNVVVRANGTEVFNNTFEPATTVGPGWSNSSTDTTPNGQGFLGQFSSETVDLSLSGLPAHTSITVSFDLYIINSWDGEDLTFSGFGPDTWSFSSDGSTKLSATFSNVVDPDHPQSFCPGGGCTPGFWKNHTNAWVGLSPAQTVDSVFTVPACVSSCSPDVDSATLLQALQFGGGSGLCGAAQILMRAAVAAHLNANAGVNYPRTPAQVVADVNAALASCNRSTILALATQLDNDNNLGCPF